MKIIACYIRVSMVESDQAKQRREINRWLKSNRFNPKTVRWYVDKSSKDLYQPKLEKLTADTLEGKVRTVVVWHFDRLALTPWDGLKGARRLVRQVNSNRLRKTADRHQECRL